MGTRAVCVCAVCIWSGRGPVWACAQEASAIPPVHALERARERGLIGDLIPRLDPQDAFANAAVLSALLDEVPHPRLSTGSDCQARARLLVVMLDGRLSRVRFRGGRSVSFAGSKKCRRDRGACQKRSRRSGGVSARQAARRRRGCHASGGAAVSFSGDTLDFIAADLGPLSPGEQLIGTYHTHPGSELEQGVLSETDLAYMVSGRAEIGGQGASLNDPGPQTDWLIDIVDPKWGDWNAFAHDRRKPQSTARALHGQLAVSAQ